MPTKPSTNAWKCNPTKLCLDIIRTFTHIDHLVLSRAIVSSSSTPSSGNSYTVCSRGRGVLLFPRSSKFDRLQFPPLTSPHAQRSHQRSATYLQSPPEKIRRYSVRVERCYDEVDEMDRQSEVEDKFRARDQEQDEYSTV